MRWSPWKGRGETTSTNLFPLGPAEKSPGHDKDLFLNKEKNIVKETKVCS